MPLLPDGPIDTLGMLDAALGLPEQLSTAMDADPVRRLPGANHVDEVVVWSPGTVGTAGEIVAAMAAPVSGVPVIAAEATMVPAHVTGRTLALVLDGGEDEAAAEVVRLAIERGAATVVVAAEGAASVAGSPEALHVPTTFEVPVARMAVGALAVHGLGVLEQLGLFAELAPIVAAAVAQLERRRTELTADANPAARLARRIGRTLPVVHGSDFLGAVAANRWKRQFNLDAKVASFAGALPGIGWDEISGWGQHGDMTRQVFSLVTLRHGHEPAGTDERMRVLDDLLDEVVHERHEVVAEGDGALAQLLDLILVGDVTAWHLAQELEIDPGPTAAVTAVWSAR